MWSKTVANLTNALRELSLDFSASRDLEKGKWCNQCNQKKLPNVYKSCPKMIDFETFTKIA